MIRISGVCDDLIKIDGTIVRNKSVDIDNDEWVEIICSDGTEAEICFSNKGIWRINIKKNGKGCYAKVLAVSTGNYGSHVEEAKGCRPYSDVLLLDDFYIEWIKVNGEILKNPEKL